MTARPVRGGRRVARTESAGPDALPAPLVFVVAAAGLVWALAGPPSGEDASDDLGLRPTPDTADEPPHA
jgi:hypothetical protein